jgi:hypothetical protein
VREFKGRISGISGFHGRISGVGGDSRKDIRGERFQGKKSGVRGFKWRISGRQDFKGGYKG